MRALAVVLCLLVVATATAGEPTLRQVFEETAAAPPERYRLGRELLLAAGDATYALANEYVNDGDDGRRALAQWLRIRRDRAEQVAVWEEALASRQTEVRRDVTETPRAFVRWPRIGSRGQHLEMREVLFYPGSEWVLVDAIRAGVGPAALSAAQVAGVMEAAPAAPFLAAAIERHWDAKTNAVQIDALVSIGEASLPCVRHLLASDKTWAVVAAATVGGRLGDTESTHALLDLVGTSSDERVVRAAAEALRHVASARGAAALIEQLLDSTEMDARRPSGEISYEQLRSMLIPFGDVALEAVASRRADADTSVAALLDGLAWQLKDPERAAAVYRAIHQASLRAPDRHAPFFGPRDDGDVAPRGRWRFWARRATSEAPRDLLRERAAAYVGPSDLVRLLVVGDEPAASLARSALTRRYAFHGQKEVFAALVAHAPDTAMDVLEAGIRDRPVIALPAYVESLFLALDHPRAGALLERIVELDGELPAADAALAVIRGEARLVDLLDHEGRTVALAAARALARLGNSAGVPVLTAAAEEARGHEYASLRDDLIRAGALPEPDATNVMRTVIRAAIQLRLTEPGRVRSILQALARHQPRTGHIKGPQPRDYVAGGHALANEVGPTARPVLEEASLFSSDRVAIHAVGRFAHDDSIPVLLRVARRAPGAAATALRTMGEKGKAAARTVPPPDPAKADFRGRGRRHVAAADTLVGEEGGIEKVLEGLAEPAPAERRARDAWVQRMSRYLSAARRLPTDRPDRPPPPAGSRPEPRTLDPRLFDPTLALLEKHGRGEKSIRHGALHVLAHFEDPRVAEAALPYLPRYWSDNDGDAALTALRGSLGKATIPYLLERTDGVHYTALLHCLWRMMFHVNTSHADRDACAQRLRVACVTAEGEAAAHAAYDLFKLHTQRPESERDEQDLARLLHYVATSKAPGFVASQMAEAALPGTAEALHASYRLGPSQWALIGLAHLRYEPAAEDVHAAAVHRMGANPKNQFRFYGLQMLAKLGSRGRELTRPYLVVDQPRETRMAAARALGGQEDTASYDAILALLDEMEAEAVADPEARKVWSDVLWAVAVADPRRAHRELVRRTVTAPEVLRDAYAGVVSNIRTRHPSLKADLPTPVR